MKKNRVNVFDINKQLMLVAYFPKRKEFGNIIELVKIDNEVGKSIQLRINEFNSFILSTEDKNELSDLKTILNILTKNDLELSQKINQEASQYQEKYEQLMNFSESINIIFSKKTKQVVYNEVVKVVEIELELINQYHGILTNILDSLKQKIEVSPDKKSIQLTNEQKQFMHELETLAKDAGYNQELEYLTKAGMINDVEDWMFTQDKYIELAYAMQSVRNDWSDGVGAVEGALDNFKCCSIRDNEIHCEIIKCLEAIENKDTDGRVFRDCRYNYDLLFSFVDNTKLVSLAKFLLTKK